MNIQGSDVNSETRVTDSDLSDCPHGYIRVTCRQCNNPPQHVKPAALEEICWLLDVRRYGMTIANELHPVNSHV
jgi:hypothetical protein